ncbi:transcription initiation factor IIB-like isoform X2 [Asparagus officinalis]|uniref:transcription initiation factor IIB-like isoform X2 n=1 Tax=Asparagus officinalis TaxID=4686 RepID=UPI00098DE243|nr:transcription initiation factor IIB-like isoform X2 [Asparagus officinalis]XP_020248558.1 transcription initiation factor IIB-like isoform X2 [Asparagus officinalis]
MSRMYDFDMNGTMLKGRFCSKLGMCHGATRAAREVVRNLEELNLRRLPASIAGAAIYMVTQLSDEKKPLKDIALVTKCSQGYVPVSC